VAYVFADGATIGAAKAELSLPGAVVLLAAKSDKNEESAQMMSPYELEIFECQI